MESYNILSVQPERPRASLRPSAFFLSVLVHVVTVVVVALGFLYAPRIRPLSQDNIYMVRQVTLNRLDEEMKRPAESTRYYPGARTADQEAAAQSKAGAASSSQHQFEKLPVAVRTLIQPDIPPNKLVMKDVSLPAVMLWSMPTPKVKVLAPPIQHPSNTALIKPSIARPNEEKAPSDIAISSTAFLTAAPMPSPSATSPVVVRGPDPTPRVPETSSLASTLPSSASVLSMSDTKMTNGVIALAPVNQTAAGTATGGTVPGRAGNAQVAGNGDANSQGTQTAGGMKGGPNGIAPGAKAGDQASNLGKPNPGGGSAKGQGQNGSAMHIAMAQNGQYSVVVVGNSLQEQYPEISDVWGGRLVYTVYLHVGLAKSWILQYTLPANAEAAAAGSVNRLEAPWPYSIVRPNVLPADVDADALMIHGFVNQAGRFESLGFAFSPGSADLRFILEALKQWQFRPAKLNGQIARVEVLVIVPLEQD